MVQSQTVTLPSLLLRVFSLGLVGEGIRLIEVLKKLTFKKELLSNVKGSLIIPYL